jgi:hypothetical protein
MWFGDGRQGQGGLVSHNREHAEEMGARVSADNESISIERVGVFSRGRRLGTCG